MKKKILSLALALILSLGLITPALAAETIPAQYTASVNGQVVTFAGHQVGDQVYIRLRDVAQILNACDIQWDGQTIAITTATSYTSTNGTEMRAPFVGEQPYTKTPASITVDGRPTDLTGILLTDQEGKGYSYFTPEDLETALGISLIPDGSDAEPPLFDETYVNLFTTPVVSGVYTILFHADGTFDGYNMNGDKCMGNWTYSDGKLKLTVTLAGNSMYPLGNGVFLQDKDDPFSFVSEESFDNVHGEDGWSHYTELGSKEEYEQGRQMSLVN